MNEVHTFTEDTKNQQQKYHIYMHLFKRMCVHKSKKVFFFFLKDMTLKWY